MSRVDVKQTFRLALLYVSKGSILPVRSVTGE
jgi:hypothetical protein